MTEEKDKKQVQRTYLLDIPVDIVTPEDLEIIVPQMLENGEMNQIVFITTLDLLRARRNSEYEQCLRNASLVIPVTKGLVRGAKFVKNENLVRHMPFEFVIRLLGVLENHNKSLYLLGQKQAQLLLIENNLRTSFPKLKIVGRYVGFFNYDLQPDIIMGIRKASPSLLLAGRGLQGQEMWLYHNRKNVNPGISVWCGECFDVFSGKKDKISKKSWEKGTYRISDFFKRPWRFLRIFIYLYYFFLLIIHKIKEKK